MKRGKFIVLEGIDGAGTTTQTELLANYIRSLSKYNDVLTTHEPWRSEEIKRRLAEDEDAYSGGKELIRLYIDDRVHHCKSLILPVLNAGGFVISDRYSMSTFAYQGAQGISLGVIDRAHREREILTPDLTIFLDVDLKVARKRISARKEAKEKFEGNDEFTKKLINQYRDTYLFFILNKSFYGKISGVDGNLSIDNVFNSIKENFDLIYK